MNPSRHHVALTTHTRCDGETFSERTVTTTVLAGSSWATRYFYKRFEISIPR